MADTTTIALLPPMRIDLQTESHDLQCGLIAIGAIGHPAEVVHRLHTLLIPTLPHPEMIDPELDHLDVVRGALQ